MMVLTAPVSEILPFRTKPLATPSNTCLLYTSILTALEGKAIIGYEGKDYELNAGESFRFDKNGLHSVTAQMCIRDSRTPVR